MSNRDKLNVIFKDVFEVDDNYLLDYNCLSKEHIKNWDSIHQLSLVSAIEDTFDVMLDPNEIVGMVSYNVAIETLKKYDVEF